MTSACFDNRQVEHRMSHSHRQLGYDKLLARGMDRTSAREEVTDKIHEILEAWRIAPCV
jgi:hypothetical protein